jgi:transposase-like protein
MAWAYKWFKLTKKHSPLMEMMIEKLKPLHGEQIKQLAEQLGISSATLYFWKNGDTQHGSGLVMSLLCAHFGLIKVDLPDPTPKDLEELETRYELKFRGRRVKKVSRMEQRRIDRGAHKMRIVR